MQVASPSAAGAHRRSLLQCGGGPSEAASGRGLRPRPRKGQPGRLSGVPSQFPRLPAAKEERPGPAWPLVRQVEVRWVTARPPLTAAGGCRSRGFVCSRSWSGSRARDRDLYKMKAFLLREDPPSLPDCPPEKGSQP